MNGKVDRLKTDNFQIASEILAYLADHPNAQDTLDGIGQWWLAERGVKFRAENVKQALARLIADGLVIEQKGRDSKTRYSANQKRLKDIEKLLKPR